MKNIKLYFSLFFVNIILIQVQGQEYDMSDISIQHISGSGSVLTKVDHENNKVDIHAVYMEDTLQLLINFGKVMNYPSIVLNNVLLSNNTKPKGANFYYSYTENLQETKLLPLYELDSTIINGNNMEVKHHFEGRVVVSSEEPTSALEVLLIPDDSTELISIELNEILEHPIPLSELLLTQEYSDLRSEDCPEGINTFIVVDDSYSMDGNDYDEMNAMLKKLLKSQKNLYGKHASDFYLLSSQRMLKLELQELLTESESVQATENQQHKPSGTDFIKEFEEIEPYLDKDKLNHILVFHDGWPNSIYGKRASFSELNKGITNIQSSVRDSPYLLLHFVPLGDEKSPYIQFVKKTEVKDIQKVLKGRFTDCINDLKVGDVTIYPNPNLGDFTLELSQKELINDQKYNVKILSSTGELIREFQMSGNKQRIIVPKNLSGMYFINVATPSSSIQKKVIIVK